MTWLSLKRFLRSPRLIVAEMVALAVAGILGASLPQQSATLAGATALASGRPPGLEWTGWLGLDHVFRSPSFLVIVFLCTASLLVVVCGQLRRLQISWSNRPTVAHFRGAPFQAEFYRTARRLSAGHTCRIWTENRIGSAGPALFHLGLLLVILAGGWRALFGAEAVVDLIEGETLQSSAAAWSAQWPGLLAKPIAVTQPVTLTSVRATRYQNGDLRDLEVRLEWPAPDGLSQARLGMNQGVRLRGGRLVLSQDFGPAALFEWQRPSAPSSVTAALLSASREGEFEGSAPGPDKERAFFRAHLDALGNHADGLEVRILKDNALIFTGDARPGDALVLPNGDRLTLRSLPFWARMRGSRDSALWLAYAGVALLTAGAVLMFALIKRDLCVAVTPEGDWERVFVALRPHRFVPLFQECFRQFLRQEGAPESESLTSPEPGQTAFPRSSPLSQSSSQLLSKMASQFPFAVCLSAASLVVFTSCGPSPTKQARRLVERYNAVVSEAYRRGDVKLIDSVVGPNEGKKITGLIGVRLDLGITLDSHLLALEIIGVEEQKDQWRVRTKECWRYRDLKIGSGEQVGEASLDTYQMMYVFKRIDHAWLVDEIQFIAEPQVTRKITPWASHRDGASDHTKPAPSKVLLRS